MRIVEVTWVDSFSNSSWRCREDVVDCIVPVCQSIGYLTKKNKDIIILSQSFSGEDVNGTISIPRKCVKEIREL